MNTLDSLGHRQQILLRYLLHSPHGLTLDQLASKLNISRNAVTQHIAVLEKLNCVDSQYLPSSGGRPSRAYLITETGKSFFPKQYALFSTMLLKTMSTQLETDVLANLLADIGKDLALPFMKRVEKSNNRVEEVRQIMNELGYETESADNSIENDKQQQIIAVNCVFHDLAFENTTVCELDKALISSLLDSPIEHTHCMAKGESSCSFCLVDKS